MNSRVGGPKHHYSKLSRVKGDLQHDLSTDNAKLIPR